MATVYCERYTSEKWAKILEETISWESLDNTLEYELNFIDFHIDSHSSLRGICASISIVKSGISKGDIGTEIREKMKKSTYKTVLTVGGKMWYGWQFHLYKVGGD